MQHLIQAPRGITGILKRLPLSNQPGDRGHHPGTQHVRCDQRADGQTLLEDEKRTDTGHRNRGCKRHHVAQRHMRVAGGPAAERGADRIGMPFFPDRPQPVTKTERLHRTARSNNFVDERLSF